MRVVLPLCGVRFDCSASPVYRADEVPHRHVTSQVDATQCHQCEVIRGITPEKSTDQRNQIHTHGAEADNKRRAVVKHRSMTPPYGGVDTPPSSSCEAGPRCASPAGTKIGKSLRQLLTHPRLTTQNRQHSRSEFELTCGTQHRITLPTGDIETVSLGQFAVPLRRITETFAAHRKRDQVPL